AGLGGDCGRGRGVRAEPGAEAGQAVAAKEGFVVIADAGGGDVNALAVFQKDAGLFAAGLAKTNEFHREFSIVDLGSLGASIPPVSGDPAGLVATALRG